MYITPTSQASYNRERKNLPPKHMARIKEPTRWASQMENKRNRDTKLSLFETNTHANSYEQPKQTGKGELEGKKEEIAT